MIEVHKIIDEDLSLDHMEIRAFNKRINGVIKKPQLSITADRSLNVLSLLCLQKNFSRYKKELELACEMQLQASLGLFLNRNSTSAISITFANREIQYDPINSELPIYKWTNAFYISQIIRDHRASSYLISLTLKSFGIESQPLGVDPYSTSEFAFLKELIDDTDEEHRLNLLKILYHEAENATIDSAYVAALVLPFYDVIKAFILKDTVLFNKNLEKALIAHNEYYDRDRKDDIGRRFRDIKNGYISLPLSAICSLAYDKGISITVESDYIPRELISGLLTVSASINYEVTNIPNPPHNETKASIHKEFKLLTIVSTQTIKSIYGKTSLKLKYTGRTREDFAAILDNNGELILVDSRFEDDSHQGKIINNVYYEQGTKEYRENKLQWLAQTGGEYAYLGENMLLNKVPYRYFIVIFNDVNQNSRIQEFQI